jgi:hypothetical protein
MPTSEMVEKIRSITKQSTWSGSDITIVWNAYKTLGHKYPTSMSCQSCVLDVINYWRAYIKEYDQANG